MKRPRLTILLGTRPEIIKLAPLILAAKEARFPTTVVSTGQHREMIRDLARFFGVGIDLDLATMKKGQSLAELSAKILNGLDRNREKLAGTDVFVVQGDTTSAAIGAYWAFLNRIPVAHVEAGLRTYNLGEPFPEEANRQLIGRLASFHFAPTTTAARALRSEGIPGSAIYAVGNTGIDALKLAVRKAPRNRFGAFLGKSPYLVVTAHRRESFGAGLAGICMGLIDALEKNRGLKAVFPVHPNPIVRAGVESFLVGHPRIHLCEPLPYPEFVALLSGSTLVLTDSGGIQEEVPSLRKPILVLRDTTERPEGVKLGFARLIGTGRPRIAREVDRAIARGFEGRGKNPYGDGRASAKILKVLARDFAR